MQNFLQQLSNTQILLLAWVIIITVLCSTFSIAHHFLEKLNKK